MLKTTHRYEQTAARLVVEVSRIFPRARRRDDRHPLRLEASTDGAPELEGTRIIWKR